MKRYSTLREQLFACFEVNNTKFNIIFSLLLAVGLHYHAAAQAQFTYVGFGEEGMVLKDWKKSSKDAENVSNGYVFNHVKKSDTLILSVKGKEPIIRKLVFNAKQNKCNFDQLILPFCDHCTQKQLEIILNDEEMKWKEIAENNFLSDKHWRTLLTVTYDKENYCTIMTFERLDMDKNDYVSLYKSFKGYATYNSVTGKRGTQ